MSKPKWKKHEAEWAEAKRKCRLNAETVRMAQQLGLNPRKLIKNIPSPSEPWKTPLQIWIRELYAKRQGRAAAERTRKAPAASPDTDSAPPFKPEHDEIPF
jgi:hypothetical protein